MGVEKNKKDKNTRQRKYKEKSTINIGTLNIVSLNGKIEEIIDTMIERKMELLGLSETKWIGSGEKELRDGYKLMWSGGSEGRNGVGINS